MIIIRDRPRRYSRDYDRRDSPDNRYSNRYFIIMIDTEDQEVLIDIEETEDLEVDLLEEGIAEILEEEIIEIVETIEIIDIEKNV